MGQQCGFNLGAGDVVAGGDDHIVGARHKGQAALFVADERIAG